MTNTFTVKNKIKSFKKKIVVSGDKSLSIRWVLLASLASGSSTSSNLLISEDVLSAIEAIKKLGIRVILKKQVCKIIGKGLNGYNYKKKISIDAKNSGTLARLLPGLLINSPYKIRITGDKSLSKRDFKRIAEPLSKFGANFQLTKNKGLPMYITGTDKLNAISYYENKGSAH